MAERPEKPPREKHPEGGRGDLSGEPTTDAPSGPGPPAEPSGSLSGTTVDHFEVLDLLGAGGFGEVYRARDTRLRRTVAVKVLPAAFSMDAERRERFRREALAASALNHPNICTIYELVEADGRYLIAMELVDGKTLQAALKDGPLPLARVLTIALQVAEALGEAHRAGILHRDVKPGNLAITSRGQVKVLDFGLAKLSGSPENAEDSTLDQLTAEGTTSGTLRYMSPEQLLGKHLDRRSDLFSFGVVLYEMVTGRLPFRASTPIALANAILHAEPRDLSDAPVPEKLKAVIRKLLEKKPERRYASAEEVHAELEALEESLAPGRKAGLSRSVRIGIVAAAVLVIAGAGWFWNHWSRERWALRATTEIARLVDAEEFVKAVALLREARAILPKDPTLEKLWMTATREVSLDSVPPGADVSLRSYRGDVDAWENLGKTPLKKVRVPHGLYVWRIAKPGYATVHVLLRIAREETIGLQPEESVPAGMVPVPGGETRIWNARLLHYPVVQLTDFQIDRHEVTNQEYKKFVDAGGYQRREHWKEPFLRGGRTLSWQEAVGLFLDTTGRSGPSTWEVGSFPKGLEKHPVAGVSWYEAAAFAEFAGKSLPTVYHWTYSAQLEVANLIIPGSNLRGMTTQPVGGPGTLSGWGTTDMAGNVKEWCRNEGPEGKRYILGGGFGEAEYLFVYPDAQSPWDRRPNFGFRCVKLSAPPPPAAAAKLEPSTRDFMKERPVSDEVFKAYKGLYGYDKAELNAKVEETESTENWTREKISFDAAYGGERVVAHLYLPKGALPPFQTVVFFPGADAQYQDKLDTSYLEGNDFVVKSGRALMIPTYKSTWERRDSLKSVIPEPTALWRDHMIAWSKDLGRSLDYLQTRKDIDSTKFAYFGASWGSSVAPILLAVEDRFQVAVLLVGGLLLHRALPEADTINFVTHVKLPVLMLNGRFDHIFPVESSQLPAFRLFGTPPQDKRHVLFESVHNVPRTDKIRESLAWLDRYLGPVKK
jgi:eukaryotic-like serine/threonine-protein kinase